MPCMMDGERDAELDRMTQRKMNYKVFSRTGKSINSAVSLSVCKQNDDNRLGILSSAMLINIKTTDARHSKSAA